MNEYCIVYKPFQVLSQFSSAVRKATLGDYFSVSRNTYPIGRLDYDSEGLLILTNDPALNHRLLHPSFGHQREYLVQVEGDINLAAIELLSSGVGITVDGEPYQTKACIVTRCDPAPQVPARNPPIRYRKNIPSSWLQMVLTEGKNRQVRKMTAKSGFPTLRLIRFRIQHITIEGMQPGELKAMTREAMYSSLFGGNGI